MASPIASATHTQPAAQPPSGVNSFKPPKKLPAELQFSEAIAKEAAANPAKK